MLQLSKDMNEGLEVALELFLDLVMIDPNVDPLGFSVLACVGSPDIVEEGRVGYTYRLITRIK